MAFALICVGPAMALDQPARKHGLWMATTTVEDSNRPANISLYCVAKDERVDKVIDSMMMGMQQGTCSKPEVQKVDNTFVIDSVCKRGATTITSRSTLAFYDDAYTIKFMAKWEGGTPEEGTNSVTIDAKWIGRCNVDARSETLHSRIFRN
jgi:hypothetical protein